MVLAQTGGIPGCSCLKCIVGICVAYGVSQGKGCAHLPDDVKFSNGCLDLGNEEGCSEVQYAL